MNEGNQNYYQQIQFFPADFEFTPSEFELLNSYLRLKILGLEVPISPIIDMSIYSNSVENIVDQWENQFGEEIKANVLCFSEIRPLHKRRTVVVEGKKIGYWKSSGLRKILSEDGIAVAVGEVRTLRFIRYMSNDCRAINVTDWMVKEYRLRVPEDEEVNDAIKERYGSIGLCRVYIRPPRVPRFLRFGDGE